jgi:Tol biopolymer transport system component
MSTMRRTRLFALLAAAAAGPAAAVLAAAPAHNGQVAFRRFFDAAHRSGAIFLINPDGTGEHRLTHPPAGFVDAQDGPGDFSADGSRLVFTRSGHGHNALWTVNTATGAERRLTPAGSDDYDHGVYSADGRRIAFGRAQGPLKHDGLRVTLNVMAADGTHVRRLVDLNYKADLGRVAWSPDGSRIVYQAIRDRRTQQTHALFVIRSSGGRAHRIGPWRPAEFNTLDWSPDGTRLLIQLTPPGSSFGGDYATIRPDGSGRHQLTHLGPEATTGAARWSPDGNSIVFANRGVGGNDDIYVMRADGGGITAVTHTPAWESAPAWGPAR